jgi:hypothetical protein
MTELDVIFARIVFRVAGLLGVVTLTPLYFMLDRIGSHYPPAITHPDFYYGFIGVGLAWQAAFLMIASDPVRFRPFMIAAILEKFIYVMSVGALYAQGQLQGSQLAAAGPDFALGILFIAAFLKTAAVSEPSGWTLR